VFFEGLAHEVGHRVSGAAILLDHGVSQPGLDDPDEAIASHGPGKINDRFIGRGCVRYARRGFIAPTGSCFEKAT